MAITRLWRWQLRAHYLKEAAFLWVFLCVFFLSSCAPSVVQNTELRGNIKVSGSTALQPLVEKAARLFEQRHPQVHIEVSGGGSLQGLKSVTAKQVDIGNSDVYADPAVFPDPDLTDHIVCVVPFTIVVHPDVTVKSLTQQQIIDIFSTGKVRNWSQVGGEDRLIVPIVRPETSGTRATFRKYILQGRDEKGTLLKTDSSTEVRDTVARTPGAIGYLARSVLNSKVRPLAINGYTPDVTRIEQGLYMFWSYEHMYTLGDDNPIVHAFLEFMLTSQIQRLAQTMNYIPIDTMKLTVVVAPADGLRMSAEASSAVKEGQPHEII